MLFYGTLFLFYMRNYMKMKLTYRADFWVAVVSDLLFQGVNLFFILIVFQQTNLLGGWNEHQILFIYGYFMIPYGVFSCFFNFWGFAERYVVKGEMDRILTRPAHNLAQLVLENMDPTSMVGSLAGLIIMGISWGMLGITLHVYDIVLLLLFVLFSVFVYAGVYVTLTAIAFFVDAPTGILPMVWNLQNYGRYPIKIYNRVLQAVLTWILPFAFVGFYPAAFFLNRAEWLRMALLTPVVGAVFLGLALLFWNYGVKHYRGAGS